ncbi:MAG: glycosyltransferase family 4 protein [Anaerolineae bacterium]|nr:glycosyltransferase family 4 protein [Anaerolineae bacterium]
MRVALLGLYPVRPDWILGGEEAVIAMLAGRLSRDPTLDLHVITFRGAEAGDRVEKRPGLTVHRLAQPALGRLTWHRVEIRRLHRLLRSLQPDVVHGHGSQVYAAAAVRSGFPAVVTVHGIMAREARTLQVWWRRMARTLDGWYERAALRDVQDLIAISPYVLEAYPWLRPARVHCIENPVEDLFFETVRQEEPARLLCPARVIPRKGILFLLQALPPLLREFPALQLRIAGQAQAMPTYFEACQSFIARQGLGRHVRFLDNLSLAEMAEEYARCTLVVLPSQQETAPVVIGEAMAVGVPVVATRVGGVPHMVQEGVTGLLVDYGDVDSLAVALRRLLSDSALRQAMGRQARAQAEQRFRLSLVAERTKQVYEDINSSRTTARSCPTPSVLRGENRAGSQQRSSQPHRWDAFDSAGFAL